MVRQIPVADKLFSVEADGPRLLGGRDRETGEIVFPSPTGSLAERFDATPLKREGILWAYTVQRFAPKAPFVGDAKNFQPYAVGYVELADEIIVETRIKISNFSSLRIGMKMRLTLDAFARNSDGDELVTYAFEPLDSKETR